MTDQSLDLNDEAIDVEEIKSTLKIGHTKVYELFHTGEIPTFKIGRRRLSTRRTLNDYMNRKLSEVRRGGAR